MKKIGVIGLGYVGLGLAIEFSKHYSVTGYDISKERIEELQGKFDRNHLISEEELANSAIKYSSSIEAIKDANFYIVTVSTPAYYYELPNNEALINATKDLASILKKGDIVIYESTVYPGTTDEVCIPLLEEISQLSSNRDFFVGYTPERINPNDKKHTLKSITKIISAQNEKTRSIMGKVYASICDRIYPVSNIRTAEAVKILENTQRDVNIALMNEFTQIMHALNIDTHEVLDAAKTKWSFAPFKPGFVGGHCIAVDPVYLAFQAKRFGLNPDLIKTARKINDGITNFIQLELDRILLKHGISTDKCNIGIFGITYKENIPDIRNSLALKLIKELKVAGFNFQAHDPFADKQTVQKKYGFELKQFEDMNKLSVAIILVSHDFYLQKGLKAIADKCADKKIIMDIPNIFVTEAAQHKDMLYWNL